MKLNRRTHTAVILAAIIASSLCLASWMSYQQDKADARFYDALNQVHIDRAQD